MMEERQKYKYVMKNFEAQREFVYFSKFNGKLQECLKQKNDMK